MTGRDPFAVGSLLERLRNVGESDLQRAEELGGRLVSELADRAMLIGWVLFVTEDLGGGGAGHRHHQDDDPRAPAKATPCELRVCASSPAHHFQVSRDCLRAARDAADSARAPWRSESRMGWFGTSPEPRAGMLGRTLGGRRRIEQMASPTREALEQEWQRLSRYHLDLRPAVLGPPEAFPDALAPLNPDLCYWPRVDPGRMREKSRAVALRIGLSFAGARRQPTTEEFYAAVHAEAPTEAQRCLGLRPGCCRRPRWI